MKRKIVSAADDSSRPLDRYAEDLIADLKQSLSNISGVVPEYLLVRRNKNSGDVKLHARYVFGKMSELHRDNMNVIVKAGYIEDDILTDYGKRIRKFLDDNIASVISTFRECDIDVSHNLSGVSTLSVVDKVVLTVSSKCIE